MSEPLAEALAAAGGVTAPPQATARLRQLLSDALRHGATELEGKRSGSRERPVTVALAADGQRLLTAVPVGAALHADAESIAERAWLLVAAVVGALVDLAEPGPPATPDDLAITTGEGASGLALLGYPARGLDPATLEELGPLAFEDHADGIDRLRARALVLPAFVLGDVAGLRAPLGAAHPLRIAEAVARLGGRPADPVSVEEHDEAVLALLGARGAAARPHEDPDPARRGGAPDPPAARRDGQVGRLPHRLRPPRARVRRQRPPARLRCRRGAASARGCWPRSRRSASATCS